MASSKPTELRLNTPKAYDGSPISAKYWLNSVRTYLLINKDVYSTDNKRVQYALSFMTEGTTKSWAAIHTQNTLDTSTFGSYTNFVADFQKTFQSVNSATEATTWLTNTCVCNNNYLPKYMGEFKLKVIEAKLNITTHTATIIHYLCAGIPVWLSDRIYAMEVVPTTPKAWYEKIDQFLSQKHFAAAVAKQYSSHTPFTFHTPTPTRSTPSRDPNAMDVDYKDKPKKLTQEEREKCFKEGHCLRCRQKGHMAAACPIFSTLTSFPIPTHSPACPPAKKVAIVETTASI